jgi:hypothetical protein
MILGGVDADALKAMDQLVDSEGISSFKLFMAWPAPRTPSRSSPTLSPSIPA